MMISIIIGNYIYFLWNLARPTRVLTILGCGVNKVSPTEAPSIKNNGVVTVACR